MVQGSKQEVTSILPLVKMVEKHGEMPRHLNLFWLLVIRVFCAIKGENCFYMRSVCILLEI